MNDEKSILVTNPLLPDLDKFKEYLDDIWSRKWITNNGVYHQQLEKALADYLGVPFVSLFTNGTLPLFVALKALGIKGEVITTPYSFVATTNSILWNGLKPVFVDVEEETGNIDPEKIEAAITPFTSAIMPVHVYGNPCKIEEIQKIADKYHLKVIYDAAHAFGVMKNGKSICDAGDVSTLSFHATKVYNTIEGGALICKDEKIKRKIDSLRNFGLTSEIEVLEPGLNGKMDEVRAAYGLLNLEQIDNAIEIRRHIADLYETALKDISGIRLITQNDNIKFNYSYFPIFIDEKKFGITRDALYERLKRRNILGRRYFYPLISNFPVYSDFDSAKVENLPIANKIANQVICLPMHTSLTEEDVYRIIKVIMEKH